MHGENFSLHPRSPTLALVLPPPFAYSLYLIRTNFPRPSPMRKKCRRSIDTLLALLSSATAVFATCQAVVELLTPIDCTPYHTSALSGEQWVQELLSGHPRWICTEFGVYQQTFLTLVQTLHDISIQSLCHVTIEEQVAIFLYTVVTGLSSAHVGEHFQRFPTTISK